LLCLRNFLPNDRDYFFGRHVKKLGGAGKGGKMKNHTLIPLWNLFVARSGSTQRLRDSERFLRLPRDNFFTFTKIVPLAAAAAKSCQT
jgi:hypothetical protein